MNTLSDTARSACFSDGSIIVSMESGAEIRFDVADNPRLAKGTAKQLDNIEISPSDYIGLNWMKTFRFAALPRVTTGSVRNDDFKANQGFVSCDDGRSGTRAEGECAIPSALVIAMEVEESPTVPRNEPALLPRAA